MTNNLFAGPNTFFFIVRCIGCYDNFFSIPDMKTAGAFCSDRAVIRQRIKENRIVRNQNGRAVLNRDRLITLKIIIDLQFSGNRNGRCAALQNAQTAGMDCCSTDHTITKTIFLQGTHKCFHYRADGSPLLSHRRLYAFGFDGDRAHCAPCGGSVMTRQPPVSYAARFDPINTTVVAGSHFSKTTCF